MIPLEQEPAFALHRKPYKENNYLIDIFSLNFGLFRASARIQQKKTHRKTNNYAPFLLLQISGQRKGELASLWQAEVQYDFTPRPARRAPWQRLHVWRVEKTDGFLCKRRADELALGQRLELFKFGLYKL